MLPDDAQKILTACYLKVVGQPPIGGGWRPTEEVLAACELNAAIVSNGSLKDFLEHMVAAFLHRTKASIGRHPSTEFYANSYLVAESAVDYMLKVQDGLSLTLGSLSSHETFAGLMRADILSGEQQYLEGPLSYGAPDLTLIRPPVWWMLASVKLKRFKFEDIPEVWLEGKTPCLSAMLRLKPRAEVLEYESLRLRKQKELVPMLIEAAISAITDATYGWLQQHRLATIFCEDGDWQITAGAGDQDFGPAVEKLINVHPNVPLSERDRNLRRFICDHAQTKGMEVVKIARAAPQAKTTSQQRVDASVGMLVAGFAINHSVAQGMDDKGDE